jgi:orotate phosphoribosyltransferase
MTNLIQLGEFQLNSGLTSDFKLVADQFIADNLAGLVALIRRIVGPFSGVYGVPRGGLALEEALLPHINRSLSSTVLVIDDVLTTGGSMKRAREKLAGSCQHIIGAVVFARGPCPPWVQAVFQLPPSLWIK